MNRTGDTEDRNHTPLPMPMPMPVSMPVRRDPRTERLVSAGKVFLTWLAGTAVAYGFKILTASDESRGFFDSEADHLALLGILYAVVFAGTAVPVVPVAAGLGDSWNWSPFTIGTVAFFATALIAFAVAVKVNLLLGGV